MRRTLLLWVGILLAVIIYAYGFTVTEVDLAELGSPTRQESLARILRALARPDFIEYEQEELLVEVPILVPCPEGEPPTTSPVPLQGPHLVAPSCANPDDLVTIEGIGFPPAVGGPLNFIPPSGVSLQLGRIETDRAGHFSLTVEMRDRPNTEPQTLRAITRRNVGLPRLSQNGTDTLDKILETVFMALLATTLGTFLAIPVSFFAAQNLMRSVTSPVLSVALSILAVPVGVGIGGGIANWLAGVSQLATSNLFFTLVGVIGAPIITWVTLRLALLPTADDAVAGEKIHLARRARQVVAAGTSFFALVLSLYFVSDLTATIGQAIGPILGVFDFLGNFLVNLGQILRLILTPLCGLIGAGIMFGLAGRMGQILVERVSPTQGKRLTYGLSGLAGAVLFALLGGGVNWFYQINVPLWILYGPAGVGGILGLLVATRTEYNASLPLGLIIYSITRTVLNALRSVEALIMVIVFAVWVGIGPFAGVLALGLHTVAALAKLYSEQVESIMAGPMEAVLAAGANRLQMIVYAVIPQIVPPYISFTMYRWDINVRMSTIIGFAGGGGIGFLLQQNINLLNYRAASAQILAIAVVVSLMDSLSSALRQRAV